MVPPLIESLQKHTGYVLMINLLCLPSTTPFGNLNLKWMDLVQRFDNINDLIIDVYECFEFIIKNQSEEFDAEKAELVTKQFSRQKFLIEEIFYWLRKSTDEIISLIYVLDYHNINKSYPKEIKIDCIGTLLHNRNFRKDFFEKYFSDLTILNEISNAFKHSFINSENLTYYASEEPLVFALSLSRNNLKNDAKFYTVSLNKFIQKYAEFLADCKSMINDCVMNQNS